MSELIRIKVFIDGNCGCALLGENLQEGEAEFVEIVEKPDDYLTGRVPERAAAFRAFHNLMKRLGVTRETHSYFLGPGLES